MKYNLIIILLFLNLIGFSQNNAREGIDKYVNTIDSNSKLKISEYDWNKITKSHIDHRATLRIWKTKDQILKVEEQFDYMVYTKNNLKNTKYKS